MSRDEWIEKINTELKDRPLDELIFSPESGISMPAFLHAEDMEGFYSVLHGKKFWQIGECWHVEDEKITHDSILRSLKEGCQAVKLKLHDKVSWEILCNDINLNHIQLILEGGREFIPGFKNFLEDSSYDIESLHITLFNENNIDNADRFRSLVKIPNSGNTIDDFASVFAGIYTELQIQGEIQGVERIKKIELSVSIGTQYFFEIIRLRSLKLLWYNLLEVLDFPLIEPTVEVHFSKNAYTENEYKNMIRAATMAMSAVLGDADRIFVLPAASKKGTANNFQRRIARNIHHLLIHESLLEAIPDPVSGSYYIEHGTKSLVEKTWDRMIQLLETGS
jgi:methylmalonyl-CoA mutase